MGVTGQVRGSGVGSPTWDVLLSTFPRNRPGNKADAEAEKAWKSATVDSTVGDLGAVTGDDADRLKDIRGEGAARPIGTTLELPTNGPAGEVLRVHNAFYDALGRGDEARMAEVWEPAVRVKGRGRKTPSTASCRAARCSTGGGRCSGPTGGRRVSSSPTWT